MANASIYAAFERMWQHIINKFSEIEKKVSEQLYEPIVIKSVENNIGMAELGSIVTDVTLTWSLNKPAVSQVIKSTKANIEVNVDESGTSFSRTFKGLSLNDTAKFEIIVEDDKGATHTKETSVEFANVVYYGVIDDEYDLSFKDVSKWLTGDVIRSKLTKKLQGLKNITFTTTANSNQYIYYVFPKRYGEPKFYVNGFFGGFHQLSTNKLPMNISNSSGYKEEYVIWMSNNKGLGETTVTVSDALTVLNGDKELM